jgi:flotillin
LEAEKAAQYTNQIQVAQSKRDYALKQAEFDREVETQRAVAELAAELQTAKTQQKIRNEEVGVKLIERQKQIQVQSTFGRLPCQTWERSLQSVGVS